MLAGLLEGLPAGLTLGLAFIVGLLVGSFLNVVAIRLPRRMMFEWRQQCGELLEQPELALEAPPDLVRTPSHCPHCGHRIRWYENIPVVSWLVLRGRCSACKAPISLQYPAVELLTALLSLAVIALRGPTDEAVCLLAVTWTLIALAVIDIREQLLPDSLTMPLLWAGLLANAAGIGLADLQSAVWGAAGGYLFLWFVYHAFKLATGKEGMGFGDFKLLAAIGAWVGWQLLPLVLVLASAVGAVFGIAVVVLRGRDRSLPIPFGPYLAAAGWLAMVQGEEMLDAYLRASSIG